MPNETMLHMLQHNDAVVSNFTKPDNLRDNTYPQLSSVLNIGLTIAVCTYKRSNSLKELLDSLVNQKYDINQIIIVDASPDDETESMVSVYPDRIASKLLYFKVKAPLKGLTRQRNFAMQWVENDLVAFFDDDVVLCDKCLMYMVQLHRDLGEEVAGVAAYIDNQYGQKPSLLWNLRYKLRMVSHLRPGTYHRSGISIPWTFLQKKSRNFEGDWLPGGAVMWNTSIIRDFKFCEEFSNYGQSEDTEFSLRVGQRAKLIVSSYATLLHFHTSSGRPNYYDLGYMAIYNRYYIHSNILQNRTWHDVLWFVYSWLLDTLLLCRNFIFPSRIIPTIMQILGRVMASLDILRGR